MSVVVREAVPADFGEIARVCVAAYEESRQLGDENHYERRLADVAARAADGEVLVAVDPTTGRVLGSVTFVMPGTRFAELSRTGEAEFRMLAVDPAAQGRGVARALVAACLSRAAERGCSGVVICYRDFVERALRLYTGMGFRRDPSLDWSPVRGVNLLALRIELPVAVG